MHTKKFEDIDEEYDLEIDRIVKTIEKDKAKKVLLQFPDGLKPWAVAIKEEIEKKLKNQVQISVWLGSCYGACDVPMHVEKLGIDLLVQFGHSEWKF